MAMATSSPPPADRGSCRACGAAVAGELCVACGAPQHRRLHVVYEADRPWPGRDPLAPPALTMRRSPIRSGMTRDQRRSAGAHQVRAKTINVRRLPQRDIALAALLYPYPEGVVRPRTREECADSHRPCPFVSCVWNLYLDVQEKTGGIKLNFPDREPEDMTESCVLDVADRGGTTLEDVGVHMNLTRERVRQLEIRAARRMRAGLKLQGVDPGDLFDEDGEEVEPR